MCKIYKRKLLWKEISSAWSILELDTVDYIYYCVYYSRVPSMMQWLYILTRRKICHTILLCYGCWWYILCSVRVTIAAQLLVDVCVLALGEEQLLSCHMAPNLTTLRLRHDILISSAANSTPVAFHSYIYGMGHTYIASDQLPLNWK